ncbi:PREDICTED: uncharacterized protein LOC101312011 [Fragaria vesca subsp. vesca]
MSEFSLQYVPQKAVNGQAIADFLAHHPPSELMGFRELEFAAVALAPWTLYFDGSRTDTAAGAGIAIENPVGDRFSYSFQLDFKCTNNQAEYEALIIRLEILLDLGVREVQVFGNSLLVVNQLVENFKCLSSSIEPYLRKAFAHKFIIVATNFFTKWVKAEPLKVASANSVRNFIFRNIISRFGIPECIVTADSVVKYLSDYGIKLLHSTPYYAQSNGQAEASNKVILGILRKMLELNPRVWHEELYHTLWAYRTSKRSPTDTTPYALMYGHDAVLPLEINIASLCVQEQHQLLGEDYAQAMWQELEDLDEHRVTAFNNLILEKQRIARSYDKVTRERCYAEGQKVWRAVLPLGEKNRGPRQVVSSMGRTLHYSSYTPQGGIPLARPGRHHSSQSYKWPFPQATHCWSLGTRGSSPKSPPPRSIVLHVIAFLLRRPTLGGNPG